MRSRTAAMLLCATLLGGCEQGPRYDLRVAPASPSHEDKVWQMDAATGRVRLCYEYAATIKCLEPSDPFPR